MTKVKICGITNLEDALAAVEFGADMLGFNFYEKSPRYISPHAVLSIVNRISDSVTKVGVFVNEETYTVGEIMDLTGLKTIQLHGDESPEYIRELRAESEATIIKAFRVGPAFQVETIADYESDYVLLDAFSPDSYGGTGERFDWKTAKAVATLNPDLYLAGGLTPDNVADAIRTVRPFAVDVASGVESSPGKKDWKKLEAFIRDAKNA